MGSIAKCAASATLPLALALIEVHEPATENYRPAPSDTLDSAAVVVSEIGASPDPGGGANAAVGAPLGPVSVGTTALGKPVAATEGAALGATLARKTTIDAFAVDVRVRCGFRSSRRTRSW